ncbi:Thoeris anti-defense Tad2 family protein [Xenorhabdus szentirmaii]|uniref:Thoeris anti-defense 2-like domain-containing protein n=1 Tax=Xenorhabdus szentirmaii DSM 16338 TaxID=1427518 RepID=W1IZX5_9GAMM|nr:MW1434 family type I TA system toxin [Xenorhabdus szentirmaii]PHM33656.1 pathogenicity protein [Xenorhabdus szentirmaii DSM 16338]PHM42310.1 pathogenicity protein [Xenorhabdus szentirmaii]CDL83181.1 conserved hypothetical protein [Xenorhabdus szentirmaii DSM 16338]
MSEFIKPEHECPFDPKQYQCDCFIAPMGSFSWALIQLKLRKRVTRSVWVNCQGNNEMYLVITPRVNDLTVEKDSAYAVGGVAVGTKYDYLTHIDMRNEHGNFVPWQPTQEDMMACDWQFFEEKVKPTPDSKPDPEPEVKPEPTPDSKPESEPEVKPEPTPDLKPELEPEVKSDSTFRLKGKITIGTGVAEERLYPDNLFGYAQIIDGLNFGAWEEISNNTPIKNLAGFYSSHESRHWGNIQSVELDVDKESNETVRQEFGNKILVVRCLGKEIKIFNGHVSRKGTLSYPVSNNYSLDEIGALFKKHIGETLEIEFIFEDKVPGVVYS